MDKKTILSKDVGFSVRTLNALTKGMVWDGGGLVSEPITTLEQVAACSMVELLRIKGFGKKSLLSCETVLRDHGYTGATSQLLALFDEWDSEGLSDH